MEMSGRVAFRGDRLPRKSRRGRALSGRGEAGVLQNAGATGEEAPALFGMCFACGFCSLLVDSCRPIAFGRSSQRGQAECRNQFSSRVKPRPSQFREENAQGTRLVSYHRRSDKCNLGRTTRLLRTCGHGNHRKILRATTTTVGAVRFANSFRSRSSSIHDAACRGCSFRISAGFPRPFRRGSRFFADHTRRNMVARALIDHAPRTRNLRSHGARAAVAALRCRT
jgi:hypothetical protein